MSRYTKQDIFNMVEEEDVEFIRLQFTDMFGTLKNVAITSSQLETVRPLRDLSVSRSRICICIRILTRL